MQNKVCLLPVRAGTACQCWREDQESPRRLPGELHTCREDAEAGRLDEPEQLAPWGSGEEGEGGQR